MVELLQQHRYVERAASGGGARRRELLRARVEVVQDAGAAWCRSCSASDRGPWRAYAAP